MQGVSRIRPYLCCFCGGAVRSIDLFSIQLHRIGINLEFETLFSHSSWWLLIYGARKSRNLLLQRKGRSIQTSFVRRKRSILRKRLDHMINFIYP